MGNVEEFIQKFQNVFAPKPKPAPPPPAEGKCTCGDMGFCEVCIRKIKTIDRETKPHPGPADNLPSTIHHLPSEPIVVRLTQPNIGVRKTLPAFDVPLEPQGIIGRLLVVLYELSDTAGNKKWPVTHMLDALTNHGWPTSEEEVRAIIPTLLQTEHLTAVQAGNRTDYKFTGRQRVHIIEEHPEVTLA
jgi:hypothetical protein